MYKDYQNGKLRVVLAGGGTGGHTFPLTAVARELNKVNKNIDLFYIGPGRGAERINQKPPYITKKILVTGKWRRHINFSDIVLNMVDIFKIILGFLQATFYIILIRPNIIFSKGGYGSFPTVIVARVFRIPVILHESDSIMGFTNKILARFAKIIILSFPNTKPVSISDSKKHRVIVLGQPVRRFSKIDKQEAKKFFDIKSDKPVLFIMGGSQGARQINNLVLENLIRLTSNYAIIHQVGVKNYEEVKSKVKSTLPHAQSDYLLYPFLKEGPMEYAYSASDLIIARAGAGGIFEKALLGKPSILIPFPHSAAGHQKENAAIYERAGACIVLDSSSITAEKFLNTINKLISDKPRLQSMGEAAQRFSKPHAAQDIAKLILSEI